MAALLGESGSGKTTLLRLIAGFDHPDSGTISLNGNTLFSSTKFVHPEKRNIGLVFQDYALFPHLSIEKNIGFGVKDKSAKSTLVNRYANLLGLKDHLKKYPHEISGGQQQRVAIARSLAAQPDLLLMDEPFSNLDESMKENVRDELRNIFKQEGITCIFVTHDTNDAMSIADRILVLHNGRLLQQGDNKSIYDEPANNYVASIFGKVNRFTSSLMKDLFEMDLSEGNYMIRPEDFEIRKSSLAKGRVVHCVYKGSYYDADIDVKGTSIHVHTSVPLVSGENIDIAPNKNKIIPEKK